MMDSGLEVGIVAKSVGQQKGHTVPRGYVGVAIRASDTSIA